MTPTSGIEFLVWLLIVAAIIAMRAKRLRTPYTVSLVLGGLLLGIILLHILSPPSARSSSRLAYTRCDFDIVSSGAGLRRQREAGRAGAASQFRTSVATRQRRCAPRRPCDRIPCALVDRLACAHCASFRVHHLCHGPHFCAGHLQGSESGQAVVSHHGRRKPSQRWNGSRSFWHPVRSYRCGKADRAKRYRAVFPSSGRWSGLGVGSGIPGEPHYRDGG